MNTPFNTFIIINHNKCIKHYNYFEKNNYIKSNPIVCTIKAQIQAIPHWNTTIFIAQAVPNSLLIETIAATQGVYNKQNIKSDSAPRGVEILQSPKPKGLKIGAMNPAIMAKILSCELVTKSNLKFKLCRNQIIT